MVFLGIFELEKLSNLSFLSELSSLVLTTYIELHCEATSNFYAIFTTTNEMDDGPAR